MMELFVAASALTCLASASCIAIAILERREALLRPSFAIGLFLFAYVQLGSTLLSAQVWTSLTQPWQYLIAAQIVPLFAIVVSLTTFRGSYKDIAAAVVLPDQRERALILGYVLLLVMVIYAVLVFYLNVVPFEQTGLYAVLTGDPDADLVREDTFKLLDAPFVTYLFTLVEKGAAPVAASLAALLALSALHRRRIGPLFGSLALVALSAAPASIYGARGPAAMIALAAILVAVIWVLLKTKSWQVRLAVLLTPVLAVVPILLMAIGKSGSMDLGTLVSEFWNVVDRVFVRGNVDNIWHLQYVESFGFHGISAIPKLAAIVGVESVDILNLVGRHFGPDYYTKFIESTSASGSMAITNYAIFGWPGHLLSLVVIVALDVMALLYRRIPGFLIVPLAAAMTVPFSAVSFSMLSTLLISKGLLVIPFIFMILLVFRKVWSGISSDD